jgi:hypothetical protein
MRVLLLVLLLLHLRLPCAQADPSQAETWFDPTFTVTGSSGERFGSSMACSGPAGSAAYIVIGAPDYDEARGRVLIYGANDLSAPIQTISSSVASVGARFGTAVAFTSDINGDNKAELVITEPRPGGFSALVHVYLSQAGNADYTLCSSINMTAGYATEVLPLSLSSAISSSATTVVVGSPSGGIMNSLAIGNIPGGCSLFSLDNYAVGTTASSLFANTLAELKGSDAAETDVVVGAPNTNSGSGYVAAVNKTRTVVDVQLGTASKRLGTSVAGNPVSGHFGYSIPNDDTLRLLMSGGSGQYVPMCTASISMTDLPMDWGRSLRLLDGAFVSFLGGNGLSAVYATYKTQADTGGSVALISTLAPPNCSSPRAFNNCVFDVNQEQGRVLAGGSACTRDVNGTFVPMLLVGSPGWNSGAGRVDIVLEGTQLESAKVCGAASPAPTATPYPTAAGETTIPVGSGTGGLPAPAIESFTAKSAIVLLPKVDTDKSFTAFLKRKLKVSATEAEKIARTTTLTYEVTLTPRSRSSSAQMSAMAEMSAMAVKPKAQKIRTRKQRVTVSRLAPGTTYRVTYRVEIAIKRPKRTFFTKPSSPTSLTTSN